MEATPIDSRFGICVGFKLLDVPVDEIVPVEFERESPSFVRALLGIYSLAENIAASMVLMRKRERWTPEFRKDLSKTFQGWAHRPETSIRLYDILSVKIDMEHFVKMYIDWLNRDGAESVVTRSLSFRDAFIIMQYLRNIQFSSMAANAPLDSKLQIPDEHKRFAEAALRAAHIWVLGTTTISESSVWKADKILEPINDVVLLCFNSFLRD